MKKRNFDNKTIIEKTVNYFKTVEPEKEVCFTQLLSECFSFNALQEFESKELFNLYDEFLKQCKKDKIKIRFEEYDGPVGLPFNLGIYRIDRPLIKKVIYNCMYGCWGMRGQLSRTYIVFEPKKITYCRVPLDSDYGKDNCSIKVSYNPRFRLFDRFEPVIDDVDVYNFEEICFVSEMIAGGHKVDAVICDAIAASVDIYYDDGKKITAGHLNFDETSRLDEIANKFTPDCFKKAIDDAEEE